MADSPFDLVRACCATGLIGLAACVLPSAAHAGRPLETDDTGTAQSGQCQVESWLEHEGARRLLTIAPACGLSDEWELDTQFTRQPDEAGGSATLGHGAGLKWAPADATFTTPLGTWSLAAKAAFTRVRRPGDDWRHEGFSIGAIATLAINASWAVDINLGPTHNHIDRSTTSGLSGALTWQPDARWLAFVEILAGDHQTAQRGGGLRWWLVPGRFGIDATAARGAGHDAIYSVGFGWYGI